MGKIPSAFLFFFARMDGKPIDRKSIIRKALEAQHRAAFTIARAEAVEGDDRLVRIICATDKPITHFLWSKWDYADIQLAMNTKAMRSTRFENGAAFLMDHNTQDQRGVIEDFEISDGELRATVKMSRSERGQELLQDIRDGIRRQISLGFMIHALELIEERKKKGEPDLYEARDWEPYEASSVAVAADIDAKVMRAMNARRDGMETCPDCGQPIDDCTCDMPETCPDCGNPMAECSCDTTDSNNASRHKRAISHSNKEENKMTPEEIAAEEAKRNQRSAVQIVRDEIRDTATALGNPKLAEEFHQTRLFAEEKGEPTVEAFMAFARTKLTKPAPQPPPMDPAAAAARQNGGGVQWQAGGGEVIVDAKKREILESRGFDLTEKHLESICTRSYKLAFREYIRKGIGGMGHDAIRSLNEGKDSDGGFLVPADFLAKMVERQSATTALQNLVTRLTTGSNMLGMPRNNYSASNLYRTPVRVNWVGADTTSGPSSEESNANLFGDIQIPIHTAMMYLDVTNNQVEDTGFDILGWLTSMFSETADVVIEDNIINGTGIGRPNGILLNPNGTDEPAQVVSGNSSALTADGLLDLYYALLGRYRKGAKFIFNSTSTEKAIGKLKDSSNRYLFTYGMADNGIAAAQPTSLLGFPIISSDFMPDVAANAFPIIWGDPSGYYLVERVGFSVEVLSEIVKTSNKVRVLGRMRIGGQVAEDWKLKVQKVST